MYHPSYSIITSLLRTHIGVKQLLIVDYGCGNGTLISCLGSEAVREYVGYEVSREAIAVAENTYPEKKFCFIQIEKNKVPHFLKRNHFDAVVLIGVLQYLTDKEIFAVLKESSKALRPGGVIVASCVTDHLIYKITNMYQFILPNRYINRKRVLAYARHFSFDPVFVKETGLLIGPLFSHGFVLFFDLLDKILFRNKGKLGPIGISMRKIAMPLMSLEYSIPFDYGYTLFLVFKKLK